MCEYRKEEAAALTFNMGVNTYREKVKGTMRRLDNALPQVFCNEIVLNKQLFLDDRFEHVFSGLFEGCFANVDGKFFKHHRPMDTQEQLLQYSGKSTLSILIEREGKRLWLAVPYHIKDIRWKDLWLCWSPSRCIN